MRLRVRIVNMHVRDVACELFIRVPGWRVQDQEQDIKSAEKSSWEIDVFDRGDLWIVAAVKRVCRCKNCSSGIQRGSDAGFGD